MKGNMNLHEFAGINAEEKASRLVKQVFKRKHEKTQNMASNAAIRIVYTLMLVLLIESSPKREQLTKIEKMFQNFLDLNS